MLNIVFKFQLMHFKIYIGLLFSNVHSGYFSVFKLKCCELGLTKCMYGFENLHFILKCEIEHHPSVIF